MKKPEHDFTISQAELIYLSDLSDKQGAAWRDADATEQPYPLATVLTDGARKGRGYWMWICVVALVMLAISAVEEACR